MPVKIEESTKLIQDILNKGYTLERLAVEMERGYYIIWQWSKGKRAPRLGDFLHLQQILKRGLK